VERKGFAEGVELSSLCLILQLELHLPHVDFGHPGAAS